jgi:hypothetical protein
LKASENKSSVLVALLNLSKCTSSKEVIVLLSVSKQQKESPFKLTWIDNFLYFFSVMFVFIAFRSAVQTYEKSASMTIAKNNVKKSSSMTIAITSFRDGIAFRDGIIF